MSINFNFFYTYLLNFKTLFSEKLFGIVNEKDIKIKNFHLINNFKL